LLQNFPTGVDESIDYSYQATFSPDGKCLAYVVDLLGPEGRGKKRLSVWDCDTGRQLFTLAAEFATFPRLVFDGAGGRLAGLIAPPGKKRDGKLIIWDIPSGKEVRTIPVLDGQIWSHGFQNRRGLAFSPDGTHLAAVLMAPGPLDPAAYGSVRVWETSSGKEVRRLCAGPGASWSFLGYSPDGKRLAVVGDHGSSLKLAEAL
jgi:WD40 repeat protein